MSYQQEIINYYNSSQWLYRLFVGGTFRMGFWDKTTKNLRQALLNENQTIIDLAHPKKGFQILDAGCGLGDTAIYIAKKTGAKVTGISLVPKQIDFAKKSAKKNRVENLTEFQIQDYTKTNFKNNFFDVVYGIESICYAAPKLSFLKEAYRLLKPKGKLIIADPFLKRLPKTSQEKKLIKEFNCAFNLKELVTPQSMKQQIKLAGFKNIKFSSRLEAVKPSVNYFDHLTRNTKWLFKLFGWLPLNFISAAKRNYLGGLKITATVTQALTDYYLILAEK